MNLSRVDLVLVSMVIIWGANITVIKVALQHFDPVVFNFIRFSLASLLMLFLYREILKDRMDKRELFSLMILGALGNTVYQFLFIYGVKLTHVTHTSILLGTTPIFTAAFGRFTGFEQVRRKIWIGILLSFAGVVLIVFGGNQIGIESLSANIGDLFVLIASFVWSIYTTYSRNVIRQYSSRHYLLYTVVFGTICMIPFSVRPILHQDWNAISLLDYAALLYSALLALVFGYSAWYYGVQRLGSTRTSVYSNLTPVAGLVVGMIFLQERLSLLQWIGAIIIFTGLLLNRISSRAEFESVDEVVDVSVTK